MTAIAIVKPVKVRKDNLAKLRAVIDYIKDRSKTKNGELVFGWNCSPDNAFMQMSLTKELFGKTTGRQYAHFVQSFHVRDNLTPELACQIGREYIIGSEKWRDFQILMAVHTNEEHMHIHYIINSVNSKDGSKWQCSKQDLKNMRAHSDELCRKYNLHVIEHGKRGHRSYGEYMAYQKGVSWKQYLASDISDCLEQSTSRADFLHRLNDCGVEVDFGEKSMLFTIAEGTYGTKKEMKCGDRKLLVYGDFSRSAIDKALSANKNIIEKIFDNPSVLMEAMYDVGRMFGAAHEEMLNRFYNNSFSPLEGRALREWILKHKDKAFEANSCNYYSHTPEQENEYEL